MFCLFGLSLNANQSHPKKENNIVEKYGTYYRASLQKQIKNIEVS